MAERRILSAHDCWALWGGRDRRSGWAQVNGYSAEVEVQPDGDYVIVREFDPEAEPKD